MSIVWRIRSGEWMTTSRSHSARPPGSSRGVPPDRGTAGVVAGSGGGWANDYSDFAIKSIAGTEV